MSLITTNLGPLTTPFTPSSNCFSLVNTWDLLRTPSDGTYGVSCVLSTAEFRRSATLVPAPTCIPSAPGTYSHELTDIASVYSPGNICPAGFETACSMSRTAADAPPRFTNSDDSSLWSALSVGETAIGCCPSGHSCDNIGFGLTCESKARSGTKTVIAITDDDDCGSITTSAEIGGPHGTFYYKAPRVVLVRQSADPTGSQIPKEEDPYYVEPPKGLSSGAKYGVGVGTAIGGILVITAGLCFWGRHWNRRSRKSRPAEQPQQAGVSEHEMSSEAPPSYETAINQTSAVDTPQDSAR